MLTMNYNRIAFTFALVCLFMLGLGLTMAYAQEQGSSVNVGQLVAPWLEAIIGIAMSLLTALAAWAVAMLQRRTGIEIEAKHMNTLQSALTNAAGKVLTSGTTALNQYSIDVRSPAFAQSIMYVNKAARDAVKHFGLDEKTIADMILNKVGVLTAPSPNISPVNGKPA